MLRILYVNRQAAIDEAVAHGLNDPQFDVAHVTGFAEAQMRLDERADYQAILLDVGGAGTEVLSFVASVRQRHPQTAVIAIARADDKDLSSLLIAGIDDYVITPAKHPELLPLVLREAVSRLSSSPRRGDQPLRVLFAGDLEAARHHLHTPTILLAAPDRGPRGLQLVPDCATPDLPLPCDIVVIEHGFPGVKTLALLQELRARRLDLPVVVVVRPDDEHLGSQLLRVGATDYVVRTEGYFQTLPLRLVNAAARFDRLREHAVLQAAHSRIESVLKAVPVGLARIAQDGVLLQLNAPALAMVGAPRERAGGLSLYSLMAVQDRDTLRSLIRDACAGERVSAQVNLTGLDGVSRPLQLHAAPAPQSTVEKPSAVCLMLLVPEKVVFAAGAGARAGVDEARERPGADGLEQGCRDADERAHPAPDQHAAERTALASAVERAEAELQRVTAEAEQTREQLEQALREAEGRYTALLERSQHAAAAAEDVAVEARLKEQLATEIALRQAVEQSAREAERREQQAKECLLAEREALQRRLRETDVGSARSPAGPAPFEARAQALPTLKDASSQGVPVAAPNGAGMERLQFRRIEAVAALALEVSHECDGLLGAVTHQAEFLVESATSNDVLRAPAKELMSAAGRAGLLIRQLGAFGRRQTRPITPLDLNAFISEFEAVLRRLMGESVELSLTLRPDVGSLAAEPEQIGQLLVGLSLHARQLMPFGGRLEIETASGAPPGQAAGELPLAPDQYVLLCVEVGGCGIDPEAQQRVVQSLDEVEPGAGAHGQTSLSSTYRQIDGHLRIDTDPGRSTAFKVFLPSVRASSNTSVI
jgi:PAS domain S-box-containing protein